MFLIKVTLSEYFILEGIIVCIFNRKGENVTKISILSLYLLVLEDSFQKKPQPFPNFNT